MLFGGALGGTAGAHRQSGLLKAGHLRARSFHTTQLLIITADALSEFRRDRIPINRHERILGFALDEFLIDPVAKGQQRLENVLGHHIPLRILAVAFELGTFSTDAVADARKELGGLCVAHEFQVGEVGRARQPGTIARSGCSGSAS